ncbi:hypothetical protein GQ53DRAFT_204393 [Thozetella sp. PMI_491]|nr:hypothetical protein GQ53DRAFT_204393 [Thozetella sp. PMI_491]
MASAPTEWRTIHCPSHQDPRYSTRSICPSCHYPRSVPVCCMFKTEAHIPDEEQYTLAAKSWAAGSRDRSASSFAERVFPPLATEFKNLSLIRRRNPCFSIVPFWVARQDPACQSLYEFLEDFQLPSSAMTIMVVREPAITSSHSHGGHGSQRGSGAQLPVWLRTAFLRVRHSVDIESADGLFSDVQQRLVFRNCNAPDPLDEGLVRLACLDPAATQFLGSIPWEGRAVSAHGVMGIPSWPIIYPPSGPFPSISSQTRGERPSHCKATVTAYISVVGVPRWWLGSQGYADSGLDRSDPSPAPVLLAYGASITFDELPHDAYRAPH